MLLYVTMALPIPHLIYFWITTLGLCLAPFFFNPHQFSVGDFIIDYRLVSFPVSCSLVLNINIIFSLENSCVGCRVEMPAYTRTLGLAIADFRGR